MSISLDEIASRQFYLALWVVGTGVALSICISVWLWDAAEKQEQHLMKNTSEAKSQLIEHQFTKSIPTILTALERMRNRWEARNGSPLEEWQKDANDYVEDFAGLRVVEWVDDKYIVKWIVPLEGNESAVNLNLTFEPRRKLALDNAKNTGGTSVSKPVELVQGGKGFLAYFPIYIDEHFDGFILGVFDIAQLINSLLPYQSIDKHNIQVFAEQELMFQQIEPGAEYREESGYRHKFAMYDVEWEIALWPKTKTVYSERSSIHLVALANGIVISVLAGFALFFLLKSLMSEKLIRAKDVEHNATLENIIDGIITINKKGQIRSINKSGERIFGYSREELKGQNIKILMPEPFTSQHDQYLENYHQTGTKKIIGAGRKVQGLRKDGEVFPLDLGVTDFSINEETFYCGILRDTSEQTALELEKEKLIKKLIRSNEELDSFAYIASHDLKEPLRAIQNYADFLKADYEGVLDEEGVHQLNRLVHLSSKMEHLISDLMYYSRLGREEAASASVNLHSVIEELKDRLAEGISENNVNIQVGKLPNIVGDRTRITELFYNLITNAYKYNLSDPKVIRILFDATIKSGAFCVQDNGIGISEQFKYDVFKIFKRLNSEKKFGKGSGAGLTFAKKIVEQHGGKLWFESELGQGTRFYFTVARIQHDD
ncbi:PAS domain S-box protein [Thalassotalea euphylliae]|uniref:PAS domain S-box protein n=1 Tax=Thalassotalea euphylliae TaxID=1655234 RepID=UPI00362F013A